MSRRRRRGRCCAPTVSEASAELTPHPAAADEWVERWLRGPGFLLLAPLLAPVLLLAILLVALLLFLLR